MHTDLQYPFDPQKILRRRKAIRKELLSGASFLEKRVAVLGGSTTHDILEVLELFLLDHGIRPGFYESEYGQYWQDAVFGSPGLDAFRPDLVYIHTSVRNISCFPSLRQSPAEVDALLEKEFQRFALMWDSLREKFGCPVIQNNFELPYYRLLGNGDAADVRGRVNFVLRLNEMFAHYARTHANHYVNDLHYLAADYGLRAWSDPQYWYLYKYCLAVPAIPQLAFSVANIIKSLYGKNKKALAIDLDNTLWGGVIGDDGPEGIEIGQETSLGQAYSEFQAYLKALRDRGIMLNVVSKNERGNALLGLNHPEGTVRPDDFIVIKANWENKDLNVKAVCDELNIFQDSVVFVDDNPAERAIVASRLPGVAVPALDKVERYIEVVDRSGFFEATALSDDDLKRNDMYQANLERARLEQGCENYEDYLKSLEMVALIRDFDEIYLQRITQLTNKSNQFNLTTKRFTDAQMRAAAADGNLIRLYGKLTDKFGDNGVVTVVIGRREGDLLHVELWLMSCRVLKRGMEHAMLDELVRRCREEGVRTIRGYYFATEKNRLVRDFYADMGFEPVGRDGGDSVWELDVAKHAIMNAAITVRREAD